jgi:hypothetical protein
MSVVHPWWDQRWIANVAWQMALIPLAWLSILRWGDWRVMDSAWWWMAGAFAVSWLADAPIDHMPHVYDWLSVFVYPIAQSVLVGAVLLPRVHAILLMGLLIGTALFVILTRGTVGPDAALSSVANLAVVWIAWTRRELPQPLRLALFVYFGLGWIVWLVHVEWLTVATWYPYQCVRLVGLLLFCWAAVKSGPNLHLVRRLA